MLLGLFLLGLVLQSSCQFPDTTAGRLRVAYTYTHNPHISVLWPEGHLVALGGYVFPATRLTRPIWKASLWLNTLHSAWERFLFSMSKCRPGSQGLLAYIFRRLRAEWGRQGLCLPFSSLNSLEDYIYPGHGHFLYGFVAALGFLSSLYPVLLEGGVPEVTISPFSDTSLLARFPPWQGLSQHCVNNSITYHSWEHSGAFT